MRVHGGCQCKCNRDTSIHIAELRQELLSFTRTMPWFREGLPSSWVRLKNSILRLASEQKVFLSWEDYQDLAEEQGLQGNMFGIATKFLHETGIIRYFGEISDSERCISEADKSYLMDRYSEMETSEINSTTLKEELLNIRSNFKLSEDEIDSLLRKRKKLLRGPFAQAIIYLVDHILWKQKSGGTITGSNAILEETVFISPPFMVNIMKGLIRHDRDTLLQFFMEKNDKVMARRVNRLSVWGRLHVDLIPFLWPSYGSGSSYWGMVRRSKEGSLWQQDVISSIEDIKRALALSEGFDLMVLQDKFNEYLVPGVLKSTRHHLTGDAFNAAECPFYFKYSYSSPLPPGAFESIIVRIARLAGHIEFSAIAAVFYKMGHAGQIFCSSEGSSVSLNTITFYLTLRASSRGLLRRISLEVERMEANFPGLVRKGLDKELHENSKHVEGGSTLPLKIRSFHRFVNLERPETDKPVTEVSQVLILAESRRAADLLKSVLAKAYEKYMESFLSSSYPFHMKSTWQDSLR